MKKNPWFVNFQPNPNSKMRLFCFPYAGGNASVFDSWGTHLPSVEVVCIQAPGRGSRIIEDPIDNLPALIDQLSIEIFPLLDKPYLFFGHSNGALVAFELARELQKREQQDLQHMFLSAKRAPQLPHLKAPTYNLPYDEFVEQLKSMNGTPKEVLEDEELMQLFLPLLRADFKLGDTFRFKQQPRLDCAVSLFGGEFDSDISQDDLLAWQDNFIHPADFTEFSGDHFFIHSHKKELLNKINVVCEQLLNLTNSHVA